MAVVYEIRTGKVGEGYTPYGNVRAFMTCHDPEVVMVGPAETGKTLAALMKLHICACKYPRAQLAIIRKTQKSIYTSVLQTYQNRVINDGAPVEVFGGSRPEWFTYPNGAQVFIGGMDNPDKVLSSERDIIYVNQAEELMPADWETLTPRTTGRAGNMPYSQCIGDCNPAHPNHWILERANEGKLTLLETTHKDNPTLWDHAKGDWTEQGQRTLGTLGNLTGARRARLLMGQWAQEEGAVYDEFTRSVHVVQRDVSELRSFIVAADEGYTDPMVALVLGTDNDRRVHIVEEFYRRGVVQEDFVAYCCGLADRYGEPRFVVDSAAAGLIAALRVAGCRAEAADKAVLDGIQEVKARLKIQGDGRPRLTVDPGCRNTIASFETYTWDEKKTDTPKHDNSDPMDALRYGCMALKTARTFRYASA